MQKTDKYYMQRCISLAKKGLGNVAPNPMVGCVIVYNNTIIGEGFHQQYGKAHAEVNAINKVKDKSLLTKSTLYVNLEPCAHFGKTPPCANLIVKHKLKRVVIGCIDSYSEVAGKGIEHLKANGIDVVVGVLKKESLFLNRRFFTFYEKKRPYIILKWAKTKDGFIDIDRTKESNTTNWITTPKSKQLVHKWRSEESAILVGTNTAINDNPALTTREWAGKNPIRMVLDANNRLPKNLKILDKSVPTVVFSNHNHIDNNIVYHKVNNQKNIIDEVLNYCYLNKVQSVIVEGGAQTLNGFIEKNIWDEARIFTGNKSFNIGLKSPKIDTKPTHNIKIDTDTLTITFNYR